MRKTHAKQKQIPSDSSDAALFLKSLQDPDIIERVRVTIKNAHVFKLPPRQTVSVGWRGADWKEKVWQGTVKVVERGEQTAVLLVDRTKGSIFAVCPVKEGAVDRCVDSSRYFVLRIENANGRHMFIGVAFNERNDAFDFNTALEDSRREKEAELTPIQPYTGPTKDYSIKEGEKIHVAIPKVAGVGGNSANDEAAPASKTPNTAYKDAKGKTFGSEHEIPEEKNGAATMRTKSSARENETGGGGLLRPSSKDTPRRADPVPENERSSATDVSALENFFSDASFEDPFPSTTFGGSNPFNSQSDDVSTQSSHPFFKQSGEKPSFDPRAYQTGKGH